MTDMTPQKADAVMAADLNIAPGCAWEGCKNKGRFAPKICVPATGVPIDCHQPLSAIFGMALCDDHIKTCTPELLLTDQGKDLFRQLAASMTRVPPDFARAWVSPVSLNSPEYKKFQKQKAQKG